MNPYKILNDLCINKYDCAKITKKQIDIIKQEIVVLRNERDKRILCNLNAFDGLGLKERINSLVSMFISDWSDLELNLKRIIDEKKYLEKIYEKSIESFTEDMEKEKHKSKRKEEKLKEELTEKNKAIQVLRDCNKIYREKLSGG